MIRRASRLFVYAASAMLLLSCTAEKPSPPVAGTAPGQASSPAQAAPGAGGDMYALRIEPREATRKTTLMLSTDGTALRGAPVVWQVNGAAEPSAAADRFDCAGTRKGDTVRAVAVVNGKELRSNDVVIGNTPPELTDVTFLSATSAQGESLAVAAAAVDMDNDKVTIQYAWTVNGVPAGNSAELGRALRRKDDVRVEVVAHDGQAFGSPVTLDRTIANHPPVFVEHQDFVFSGSTCVYRARATDADGDQITYALDSPVPGMSIGGTSGEVVWKVPAGFTGEQPFTIIADDGHLGTARYTVAFTIRD